MSARLRIALVTAAASIAVSCGGGQNLLEPAGPAAVRIAGLAWLVLGTFTVVSVVMWLLIFWLAARRKGTLDTHLPWNAPEDSRWITVGGFTIPVIVLATLFVVMLRSMSAFPMGDHETPNASANIRVIGHQWWWEVEYLDQRPDRRVITANELHIPTGRPIDLELRSYDVIHSFWVPRLHGKVDLVPGAVTRVRLQADSAGAYRGQCGEYCGPQHARMALTLVAETPDAFDRWLDSLRSEAPPPTTDVQMRGEQLFMTRQCVLCHTIRGTAAMGTVGPDLTHLASRAGIAANAYPNATAPLSAWVTHAQSLKPLARMPSITAFTGDELQALVGYLQSLK